MTNVAVIKEPLYSSVSGSFNSKRMEGIIFVAGVAGTLQDLWVPWLPVFVNTAGIHF